MMLSQSLREISPQKVTVLFGAKNESEILFEEECRFLGFHYIAALSSPSNPGSNPHHFHGRVTDYLTSLSAAKHWQETDFYLCGNGAMVMEVTALLQNRYQVSAERIQAESYFSNKQGNPSEIAQAALVNSILKIA